MNQDLIKDAFKTTLDSLDVFLKWFLSISVVVWWAGLSAEADTINILEMKIARKDAFAVVGVFFIIMNTVFLFKLKRLHFLIRETNEDNRGDMITILFTHDWILNPFGIFNYTNTKNLFLNVQRSLLVIIWWLCNMSLYGLYHSFKTLPMGETLLAYCAVFGTFLIIGLASLKEILSITKTLYLLSRDIENESIKARLTFLNFIMKPSLVTGIVIGFIITYLIVSNIF